MDSSTPRPLFTPRKDPVPIVQEAGWVAGPVWTGAENFASTGIRIADLPARIQSLYPLRFPAHSIINSSIYIYIYIYVFSVAQYFYLLVPSSNPGPDDSHSDTFSLSLSIRMPPIILLQYIMTLYFSFVILCQPRTLDKYLDLWYI